MNRRFLIASAVAALAGLGVAGVWAGRSDAADAAGDDKMVIHNVYFTLKDNSPEARKKLVTACRKYLSKHPGTVFFGVGTVGNEFDRPVNVRDWDVALNLVFKDKAAHDKYQDDPEHKKFIDENKDNWKSVRVFDAVGGQ